jgi:hypothetical protein
MTELRTIQLPAHLCAEVEIRYGAHFDRVEDLLAVVLQELLRNGTLKLDQAEEQIVEERLRDLGYI